MRRPRHPRLLVLGALLLLVVAPVAWSAVSVWRAAHVDEASTVDHADVIVVLGAAQYGGDPSPIFAGRLDHGALLYREGFADDILVLGAGQEGDETTEAEAGARYLRDAGIPDEDVFAEPVGTTTFESLEGAAEFMDDRGMASAFLVSDPWHNLRVRKMARDLGIEGFTSATFHSAARSQATRFEGYVRETFAYLYYVLVG